MKTLGRHIVVEFYGCSAERLADVSHIEQSMVGAAEAADATVVNSAFHHFSPFGVSGVVVIQESHLAIHTWPEYGYAAIDVFTCGDTVDPWTCYDFLHKALEADNGSAIEMGRGQTALLGPGGEHAVVHPEETDAQEKPVAWTSRNIWFTERNDDVALSLRHSGEILFRETSDYQKVEVIDTMAYGKMLTLDGHVMTTEKDEYVYHEMITHVPLLALPDPKRVLVVGGGDGGAVREILRHPGIETLTLVEIDEAVVRACREHLPEIAAALDHPKLNLQIADGIKYVNGAADESYDLIIIDSTDPAGPAEGLFTEAFYRQVYRVLAPDGAMVCQSESPRFNTGVFQEIYQVFRNIYGPEQTHCYLIAVPTYPSGSWSLAFCSKGAAHPLDTVDAARQEALVAGHKLRYYNPGVHTAAFALPNFVQELLGA